MKNKSINDVNPADRCNANSETDVLKDAIEKRLFYRRRTEGPRSLIVFVHGASFKLFRPSFDASSFSGLLGKLLGEQSPPFSESDLLPFTYNNALFRGDELDVVASNLSRQIQERCDIQNQRENNNYSAIYLVGFSVGSLVARKAVLISYDSAKSVEAPWCLSLRRLILLANANRGFELVRRENTPHYAKFAIALIDSLELQSNIFKWFRFGRQMTDARRDSPWIKDLRIAWLRRFEGSDKANEPEAVQIFGSEDQLVGDDDLQDFYQFQKSNVIKLEKFTHDSFMTPRLPGIDDEWPSDRPYIQQNYDKMRKSFTEKIDSRLHQRETRKTVVFLIHGIRDYADWQENVSYLLRKSFSTPQDTTYEIKGAIGEIEVVSVRYGYFNAFQFLFPSQRRRSVRAFVDAYFQTLSRFPNVEQKDIHVFAHSNGTFVLGQALEKYREIKVNRVILAGSVLPKNFDWKSKFGNRQVMDVRNECGNIDWPVGLLCHGLSWFPIPLGIGEGGYAGFEETTDDNHNTLVRNTFLSGGHSAGLRVDRHKGIAEYLVRGTGYLAGDAQRNTKCWFHFCHHLCNALIPLAVVLLSGLLIGIGKFEGYLPGTLKLFGITLFTGLHLVGLNVILAFGLAVVLIYVLSKL